MPVLRADHAEMRLVKPGVSRCLVHGQNVMMAVVNFSGGPWSEPEPLHHHVHEQATFVAEGEIIFFCEGEEEQPLKAGDMFWVPSGKKHGIQLLSKSAKLVDSFYPIREDFLH